MSAPYSTGLVFPPTSTLTLDVVPYESDDFTAYVKAGGFRERLTDCIKSAGHTSPDIEAMLRHVEVAERFDFEHVYSIEKHTYRGRLHAALCFQRTHFSLTLRKLEPIDGGPLVPLAPRYSAWHPATRKDEAASDLLKPPVDFSQLAPAKLAEVEFAESIPRVARLLYDRILATKERPHGLVLVSGETGSGKTQYLNTLLSFYLRDTLAQCAALSVPPRRPHVVVIGDPIETPIFKPRMDPARHANAGAFQADDGEREIDFTARTLGIDVASVKDALRDALRETPTAVVVNELRKNDDFRAVLDFAATGHLVFATSHNSSLTDAVEKLMRVSKSQTPSSRATLVQRLLGIIHLQAMNVTPTTKLKLTLPALWRSNSSGMRNFVAEGLSSIQHRATDADNSTLGYLWAAHELAAAPCRWTRDRDVVFADALDRDLNAR